MLIIERRVRRTGAILAFVVFLRKRMYLSLRRSEIAKSYIRSNFGNISSALHFRTLISKRTIEKQGSGDFREIAVYSLTKKKENCDLEGKERHSLTHYTCTLSRVLFQHIFATVFSNERPVVPFAACLFGNCRN